MAEHLLDMDNRVTWDKRTLQTCPAHQSPLVCILDMQTTPQVRLARQVVIPAIPAMPPAIPAMFSAIPAMLRYTSFRADRVAKARSLATWLSFENLVE